MPKRPSKSSKTQKDQSSKFDLYQYQKVEVMDRDVYAVFVKSNHYPGDPYPIDPHFNYLYQEYEQGRIHKTYANVYLDAIRPFWDIHRVDNDKLQFYL